MAYFALFTYFTFLVMKYSLIFLLSSRFCSVEIRLSVWMMVTASSNWDQGYSAWGWSPVGSFGWSSSAAPSSASGTNAPASWSCAKGRGSWGTAGTHQSMSSSSNYSRLPRTCGRPMRANCICEAALRLCYVIIDDEDVEADLEGTLAIFVHQLYDEAGEVVER